ncbi:MAG: YggT family protein [bacterium]|nr:YggT family protein [bacterium]
MNPLVGLANILDILLGVYLWIVFVVVLLSWIPLSPQNLNAQKIVQFLHAATEPVFGFFRKHVRLNRYNAPFDLTPLFTIVTIYFLRIFVVQSLKNGNPVGNLIQGIFSMLHFVLGLYLWVALIAAVLALMHCFFPQHRMAGMRIPLIDSLTTPVLERFRKLFGSPLHAQVQGYSHPLDLAPLLLVFLVFLLVRVI